jgi:hypothetical protein
MKNPMTAQTEYLNESEERGVAASETVQRRNVRRRIGPQDSDVAAEDIDEPVHHERQDQQLEHVSHRGGPQAENRQPGTLRLVGEIADRVGRRQGESGSLCVLAPRLPVPPARDAHRSRIGIPTGRGHACIIAPN